MPGWIRGCAVRDGVVAGAALLAGLALVVGTAPWWTPDPAAIDLGAVLRPPGAGHWLGTDSLGRDVLSRVLRGGRASLTVGLGASAFALGIGLPLGLWSGYRRGPVDAAVTRVLEAVLCVPTLLLLIVLVVYEPAWASVAPLELRTAFYLGALNWPVVTRYVRAEVLQVAAGGAVEAARALGAGETRILFRHVLPQAVAPALVVGAFSVGGAVLLESTLAFLGYGAPPPRPTWGGILQEAGEFVDRAWWLAAFPGLMIFATVAGCLLLGEGLRARLNPRGGSA